MKNNIFSLSLVAMVLLSFLWPVGETQGEMAWVQVVALVVSALASSYAAVATAQTQKNALEYNAKLKKIEADQTRQRAMQSLLRKRAEDKAFRERQLAAMSASGFATGTGSSLMILAKTAAVQEQENRDIATSAMTGSQRALNESMLLQRQGKAVGQAGYINAGANLLGGAVNAYDAYETYKERRA